MLGRALRVHLLSKQRLSKQRRDTTAQARVSSGRGSTIFATQPPPSPAVALRYQQVMAGRDQAIAAALDELVQAAPASCQSVRLSRLVAR